jgi:tetratricopeptide (TPR) repeat protein
MYYELGDLERARALHEENLDRARAAGNERIAATTLSALAEYALREGRVQEAVPMLKEADRIHRNLGHLIETAVDLYRFAYALALEGRAETAAQLVSRADALREEIGASMSWIAEFNEPTRTTIRSQLDEAALADAMEQGRALTVDQAIALALEFLD